MVDFPAPLGPSRPNSDPRGMSRSTSIKALLAALQVSPNEGDRAWLRGRLEAHAESPYVLAARGGPGDGFEALEEELQVRLRDLRVR